MFGTILAGVIVFIISQFILKLILEPIVSLKEKLGLLSAKLLRHQSAIVGGSASKDIIDEIQEVSASVLSSANAIPFYPAFSKMCKIPSARQLLESCRSLNVVLGDLFELTYGQSPNVESPKERRERLRSIGSGLRITTTYAVSGEK
ncbi:hypothetical protein [Microbulbifer mangrovi]|uniref:hypothetical protein n=1 Tax=Microbulbifer mangrovi TaxID=927787 RepID=UPI0011810F78|nr:hypothetical protein [Microbulbifer mangrovi]